MKLSRNGLIAFLDLCLTTKNALEALGKDSSSDHVVTTILRHQELVIALENK